MRNRMHIIIPAAILLVLIIPAIAIYNQHQRDKGKKADDTKETMRAIFAEIPLTEGDGFTLPAEPISKLDGWGAEIKIELKTEKASGIHIFKKPPQIQMLRLYSDRARRKMGHE